MTGHAARLLKAVGALVALLAVVVGVPVLMAVLHLVPDSMPSLDEVDAQVQRAADEAASAFGDATVFCEPFVESGRHVEVQVLADGQGGVLTLGERECSIQRRHQKLIEESPSPALSPELREEMGLAPDPMAAYAASGYFEKIAAERVGGQQAGWGA